MKRKYENINPSDFLPDSYKRNNNWAVSRLKRHLTNIRWGVEDKKEDFGVDIIAYNEDNEKRYIEAEVKIGYEFTCEEDYQFPTVHFLERKKKWNHLNFLYFIICRETEHYVVCNSKNIYKPEYYKKSIVSNRDRGGFDYFYGVPVNKCLFGKLRL